MSLKAARTTIYLGTAGVTVISSYMNRPIRANINQYKKTKRVLCAGTSGRSSVVSYLTKLINNFLQS